MKRENREATLFMLVIVAMMIPFLAWQWWPRPTEVKTAVHIVEAGDTAWDICEKYYMPNNTESFNKFLHSNIEKNNLRGIIQPGQVVLIRNEVYK